ncbi:MAG: hypothetical protein L0H79_07130 [Intrasporangium sp.]|uniref:PIN domain-containing protein n=1 Tax=Intrasporangium sp. TaxID=1925024 RepID=UPI0026480E30|nr:PIN domain-containing protein [Intrasporangium sp.]MDN5795511.1 hypothetical protein [Intrasporangium sp.]
MYWSEGVVADTIHHLRKQHPCWDGKKTSNIRDLIASTFEVGRVADYVVDGTYPGPDPHDAHVHAAAVACHADILLTGDIDDFPECEAYEVMFPDEFLVLVDDSMPDVVWEATHNQASYRVARCGECDLPARLRAAGAPRFAERVRVHPWSGPPRGSLTKRSPPRAREGEGARR